MEMVITKALLESVFPVMMLVRLVTDRVNVLKLFLLLLLQGHLNAWNVLLGMEMDQRWGIVDHVAKERTPRNQPSINAKIVPGDTWRLR